MDRKKRGNTWSDTGKWRDEGKRCGPDLDTDKSIDTLYLRFIIGSKTVTW